MPRPEHLPCALYCLHFSTESARCALRGQAIGEPYATSCASWNRFDRDPRGELILMEPVIGRCREV